MLVPVIFVVALLVALTGALLNGSFAGAKIASDATVARYTDVTIAGAVADFTHGLAAFVAAHGTRGPWPRTPSRSARKSACDDTVTTASDCPFSYEIDATITAASAPGDAAAGDDAINLQAAAIDEQRVSAIVTTHLIGTRGAIVGSATRYLTYRVFATAPYAIVSGSRTNATINASVSATQGDSGGAPATPAEGIEDTRIHVRLTCANVQAIAGDPQAAANDGLPWGNAAQAAHEAPCTSPDAPADAFRDEHWTNGNANTSGWTQ